MSVLRIGKDAGDALDLELRNVEAGNTVGALRALGRVASRLQPDAASAWDSFRHAASEALKPWYGGQAKALAWTIIDGYEESTSQGTEGSQGFEDVDQGPEEWPERPDLPGPPKPEALPLDGFPPVLRGKVESIARSVQVSPDLPAGLVLGAVSAAVAGKVYVEVDRAWDREWVCLYVVGTLPPAERKSPAYRHAIEPLQAWEAEKAGDVLPRRRVAQAVVKTRQEAELGSKGV